MRKFVVSTALAGLLVAGIAPAFADEVFGHSAYYTAQALAAEGYNVTGIEEWGTNILATVVDAQGHTSFKVFDPDTLNLVP